MKSSKIFLFTTISILTTGDIKMAGLPAPTSGQQNPDGSQTYWDAHSGTYTSTGGNQGSGVTSLTPEQIAAMNAQTSAYQSQTNALQKQIDAQTQAANAGPTLQYNPLNDDGTLKDTFKLGSAASYTDALKSQEMQKGATNQANAATQSQTATDQATQNLAMRGGVGTNNAALLQAQGLKQGLANQQQAASTTQSNLANIGVQGAGAQLQVDKANLGTQLTAAQNVNSFDLDKYNQNMAVNAANTQAKATTDAANNSGGK
jgi:hypothetical protein